jgi:hypothetical protein
VNISESSNSFECGKIMDGMRAADRGMAVADSCEVPGMDPEAMNSGVVSNPKHAHE